MKERKENKDTKFCCRISEREKNKNMSIKRRQKRNRKNNLKMKNILFERKKFIKEIKDGKK